MKVIIKDNKISPQIKKNQLPVPTKLIKSSNQKSNSQQNLNTVSIQTNEEVSQIKKLESLLVKASDMLAQANKNNGVKRTNQAINLDKAARDAGIYAISGFEWGGLSSHEDNGLVKLSKYIDQAKDFKWQDENSILNDIQRKSHDVPIILMGHSFGGDTAVAIANALNTPKYHFRKVDLLVTIDSVGFNNDIIPGNVTNNFNYIGDKDLLYNDGPNIARDIKATEVRNELRSELHDELDDTAAIQSDIIKKIDTIMDKFKQQKMTSN